jgi:hypothetical protein
MDRRMGLKDEVLIHLDLYALAGLLSLPLYYLVYDSSLCPNWCAFLAFVRVGLRFFPFVKMIYQCMDYGRWSLIMAFVWRIEL